MSRPGRRTTNANMILLRRPIDSTCWATASSFKIWTGEETGWDPMSSMIHVVGSGAMTVLALA